jgi:hypothetical protein
MNTVLWLFRAMSCCILVFLGFVLCFPVQLVRWLVGKTRWSETLPYLYLDYLFAKGVASPDEKLPPFERWRYTRFD